MKLTVTFFPPPLKTTRFFSSYKRENPEKKIYRPVDLKNKKRCYIKIKKRNAQKKKKKKKETETFVCAVFVCTLEKEKKGGKKRRKLGTVGVTEKAQRTEHNQKGGYFSR
eukprot:TRINITY_DN860_c1_g4_i1.p1 TRINITY_DN860_c1_g4~~TRINITY_DN860_c1_g4_i1.p1  ORF type:complete len:110 (-),score=15.53 TRINITY_DN860_c1_g4_i1:117-446(-)